MASNEQLTKRESDILMDIIRQFIRTGEPVGSRTISMNERFTLSSATIRNVMADLEEKGFLIQPHTSAGRIPTDLAYRHFVTCINEYECLSVEDQQRVKAVIAQRTESIRDLLLNASLLLSNLTLYAGVVLLPELDNWSFRRIDLISLTGKKIVVILVSEAGLVSHKLIEIDDTFEQDELDKLANFMNSTFVGMTLAVIRRELAQLMEEDRIRYDKLLENVVKLGKEAFQTDQKGDLYIGGTENLLIQPEFKARIAEIYQAISEKNILLSILNRCLSAEDPVIVIGQEKPELKDMSLITVKYYYRNQVMGTIGVIGPTRMHYPKIVSLVNFTARTLTHCLDVDYSPALSRSL